MRPLTLSLLLFTLALAACGGGAPPGGLAATAPAASGPLRGPELPGRLLFVREGVVWSWSGGQAGPLFGDGGLAQPALSPDGQRVAYVRREAGSSALVLADLSGAPVATLAGGIPSSPPTSIERVYASNWVLYPAWAPDGQRLALAAQPAPPAGDPPAEFNLGLYLLPLGGAPLTLAASDAAQYGRSAFSPDGASLVAVRAGLGAEGRQELYRVDLAGGQAGPLPGAPAPSYDPAFAPDGQWLAFAARDGGATDIFAMPAGGGAPLRLTSLGAARAPAFAPDGRWLAFLAIAPGGAGFDLWVAELARDEAGGLRLGAPQRISEGLGLDADSGLSWGPAGPGQGP